MKRVLLTVILALWGTHPVHTYAQQRYDGPIIDMHLHAKTKIFRERQFCFPKPCEGAVTLAKNAADLKPMTLDAMARNNIVLGVISDKKNWVLPWTESEGDRFLTGIAFDDPSHVSLDELRDLVTSGRVQVLGELFSQYEGIAIDDPSLEPFFLRWPMSWIFPFLFMSWASAVPRISTRIWAIPCDLYLCFRSIQVCVFIWKMRAGRFSKR